VSEFDIKIDYYAVLGVAPTASEDEIQKAYRALAAKYHPDKHQGNELEDLAKEKLTQLNTAVSVIGNPERRARYDAARRTGPAAGIPEGTGTSQDPIKAVRTVLIVVAVLAALFFGRRIVLRLGELMLSRWQITLIAAALIGGFVFLRRALKKK
jgi:curved DNA-binding protein CbpA